MRNEVDKLESLIKHFNWHSPSWDLFIFLFWAVASVIYSFAAGRGRVLSILVSVYMSKLLVIEAPFLSRYLDKYFQGQYSGYSGLGSFVILFLLLFLFLSRYAFKTSIEKKQVTGFVFTLLFSILQIGLLINIVVSLLPVLVQQKLSPLVTYLFIGQTANFVWLVAPVVFLVLLGRHISQTSEV